MLALSPEIFAPVEKPENLSDILTCQEIADYLRVHKSTIYRLIQKRAIPVFRIGSDYRMTRKTLEEWLRQTSTSYQTTSGTPPRKR